MAIVSNPPEFYSQLSPEKRSECLMRADLFELSSWPVFDLRVDVIFERYIMAENGGPESSAYCAGTRGGEVELYLPSCNLEEHSGGETVEMNVEVDLGGTRTKSETLEPEVNIEASVGKVGGKLGSRSNTEEEDKRAKASYTVHEATIGVKSHQHGIGWQISRPDNPHAPVQYLYGSRRLKAVFSSEAREFEGTLTLRPAGYAVYDARGRYHSDRFTVMAMLLGYKHGKPVSGRIARKSVINISRKEG